jgi:DNA-directed RNA polymerase specialized sigma24 family protein
MEQPEQDQACPNCFEDRKGAFTTTHWSMVLSAGQTDVAKAKDALEQLCRVYWFPIYAFIRRTRGIAHHDAEELTQEFFRHLFQYDTIKRANQARGKFRTFLLKVQRDLLTNDWAKKQTLKRGGGKETISLDYVLAEKMYALEPVEPLTPEKLFDRNWAFALLDRVLSRLESDYAEQSKSEEFTKFAPFLSQANDGAYLGAAKALGITVGAAKVRMHRLRRRYRDLLANEVRQTVSKGEEVEEELRHLLSAT